jgi:hypothetical protein
MNDLSFQTDLRLPPLGAVSGDPSPAWPLPGVLPSRGAPQVCVHTDLEHVGVDLPTPVGLLVVATERSIVERAGLAWQGEMQAMVLRTGTGLILLLGGLAPESHRRLRVRDGATVDRSEPIGRIGTLGALHLEVHDGRDRAAPARWWRGEPPPSGILDPSTYLARIPSHPQRPQPAARELLLQWRLLQARRAEYTRLAADSGAADAAAAAALLRVDVKAFIDRLRPPRFAAEPFLQAAPAGWQGQMEVLLDMDPLVPDLITRSSEVQRA